jgi:hypothetical protein
MPRRMTADDGELFRAVIVERWGPDDARRDSINVLGPFRTKGAAVSAITRRRRELAHGYGRREIVRSDIERARTTWERVTD